MNLRITHRRKPFLGLALLVASAAAQSLPIIVDTANDNLTAGDGLCSLREAIDNANWDYEHTSGDCESGVAGMDTIQILDGLSPIILNGTELEIGRSMAIIGPPAGQDISGDGISRVLHLRADLDAAGSPEYRLENLRIVHGRTTGNSAVLDYTHCEGRGAGICAVGHTQTVAPRLTLRNVHVHNSRTTGTHGDGAGLFARVAELTVERAWFDNNQTDQGNGGAAMVAGIGRARFDNVHLSNNGAGSAGGGIHARTLSSLTVNRATFVGSTAHNQEASALSVEGVDQTFLSNSVITESFNYDAQGNYNSSGYAVRVSPTNTASTLFSVANAWVDDNHGCGLHVVNVPTFISQSTISRNDCAHDGAALRIDDATVEVTASSLVNNVSPFAAVSLDGGRLTLQSATVVGNQATNVGEAGGVRLDDGVVVLRSTILADNAGDEGSFERIGSSARIDVTSSLFSDGAAEVNGSNSGNLFQGGAMVGALGDYGCAATVGESYVNPPVGCVQMRALSANSPAIDQGQAHGAAYDQRGVGFARVEGVAADIGAYEYQAPQISIEAVDASKVEGNSGTTAFSFRLRRNGDTRAESWAAWNIQGHGANPADSGDFPASTWIGGTAYFAVGTTETTFNVYVNGDTAAEPSEGFRIALGALTNGAMGSASTATGQIINDDSFFPSAVLSLTRLEGDRNEGQYFSTKHRFRVTRAQVTSGICSFQLEVLAGSGPFVPDAADFVGWTPGVPMTYVMLSGATQWDIDVDVAGDSALEFDETFELKLQNASGCGIDTNANQVSSTVLNDDSSLWIEAVTASAPEGHAGSTPFSMMLRRGSSDLHPATVTWTVSGTGANPASAADFSGGVFPSGTTTFAAGQSEMLMVISVAGDASNEPDEGFRVTLSNPSGGDIYPTDHVDATIVNDDTGNEIFKNSFE
jgi:hypothetical protein